MGKNLTNYAATILLTGCAMLSNDSQSATYIWDGGGGDNNWGTANNWNPNGSPPTGSGANNFVFAGTTRIAPRMNDNYAVLSITFSNNANSFTISSAGSGIQTLTLGPGGIINQSVNLQSFTVEAIALAAAQAWDAESGDISFGAPINNGGHVLTIAGPKNTALSGIVSGSGGITKVGDGTLTFGGINTFTGKLIVNAGIVSIAGETGLGNNPGAVTADQLTLNGGTLQASTSLAINDGNRGITLGASGGTFSTPAAATTLTIANLIVGSGGLTKAGAGTLTLGGVNTFSGKTIVNAGTVSIGVEAALGNNPVAFTADQLTLNGGTLEASTSLTINDGNRGVTIGASGGTFSTPAAGTTLAIANVVTGSGNLTKAGSGTLSLSGNNTYSGVTTISAGTLQLGSATALGTTAGNTVVSASGAALDLNGRIVGNEELEITGTGISGAGALINNSGAAASLAGDVNNTLSDAGVFSVGGAGDITLTGNAQGKLTKVGNNTLTLGGTVDNVGLGVTANAGTVVLGKTSHAGVHAIGGAGLTMGGGTVKLGGTGEDQIYDHSVVTVNSGTFDFNGKNETFDTLAGSGGTILNNGGSARILTISLGGGSYAGVIANRTSGSGTMALVKSGTGTETLSGVNTYSGATTLKGGVLRLNNGASLPGGLGTSGGTSALTFNGGVLGIGAATNFVRGLGNGGTQVQWTGSGGFAAYGGARSVNLGGATATVTWNSGRFVPTGSALMLGASDADNTLTFQNPINFNNAIRTIQVDNGSASTDAIISGALSNGGLNKTGTGTLDLTADNSYSGATTVDAGTLIVSGASGDIAQSSSVTINSGATLRLSNTTAANNGNRIGTVGFKLNGGTFEFDHPDDSGDYLETAGTLTLSSGAATIISDAASGSGGSSILTFGALSRSVGATVNFVGNPSDNNDNNNVVFSGLANVNGIIGGWATVGSDWASWQTGNDSVEALGTYEISTTIGNWGTTENISINANPSANLDARTINSLRLTDNTGSQTVTINSGQTLTLTTGGLMAINNATKTVTGGTLRGASGADLVVIQSGGTLSISSVIADNTSATALTKSGTGTLIVGGNNTFTGGLYVNQGVVQLTHAGALNSTTPNAVTVNGPGTLRLNGNSVTVAGLTGAGTVQNNHASTAATLTVNQASGLDTFSGVIQDGGAAALGLNKTGDGTLVLNGANTYTGGTTLTAGNLELGDDNVLGGAAGGLTLAGGVLDAKSRSVNIGVLSLSADSTLNLLSDGNTSSLTFISADWTGGNLTITGWSGIEEIAGDDDRIFISGSVGAEFLGHVVFDLNDQMFFATMSGTELVPSLAPVPEPTEWALILFAALAVCYKFAWPRLRGSLAQG